jgi:oxygen-independent coproporphyrinogen-3 oxidase
LISLKKEIDSYSHFYSRDNHFTSIYFGGGTPSLMDVRYISEIIEHLYKNFSFSEIPEITLETNPGTVNRDKLKDFFSAGINRLSIGIQSFHEDDLKFLTRIHDKATAINTVYNAADAGFENINADLIFNLPGQTKRKWLDNLKTTVTLPVKHISAYSLILERGTILNKMVIDGKVKISEEDYDAELYEATIGFLESESFSQYEVSNFSKEGFECIHNKAYWEHRDYLSFGPSAHSFVNGKRWWNFSGLRKYISEIEKNSNAVAGSEIVTNDQSFDEYIMLALRSSGINLTELQMKFGDAWLKNKSDYLSKLQRHNLLTITEDNIRLTRSGYAVCDEILSEIL